MSTPNDDTQKPGEEGDPGMRGTDLPPTEDTESFAGANNPDDAIDAEETGAEARSEQTRDR